MDEKDLDTMLKGQAAIWRYTYAYIDSMALKCAVELGIAEIIRSHGRPITLQQIADSINGSGSSVDITSLARVMRLLAHRDIFTAHRRSDTGDTLYGLNHSSMCLLPESEFSLAPLIMAENHPVLLDPWHYLSHCVKDGGSPFKKAHGTDIWEVASKNPEFNKLFNHAMACTSKNIIRAVFAAYKDGFRSVGSLVDVGGGMGGVMAEIVKAYPNIRGINFDLPHVVAGAPDLPGVEHVSGDMFESIPPADAVFMKWILHDWGDEYCVKILKNCRNAIPENGGKLIIVDAVLQPEGDRLINNQAIVLDLKMFVHTTGGKERTELEWKNLLVEGGFPRHNIINITGFPSIIEAFPN